MAGKFEPKTPVNLDPPKDDPITVEELAKCNGIYSISFPGAPFFYSVRANILAGVDSDKCYVAIKVL
jgi:hypothetical protein